MKDIRQFIYENYNEEDYGYNMYASCVRLEDKIFYDYIKYITEELIKTIKGETQNEKTRTTDNAKTRTIK
jgi:ribonucleotide reductase beta subunit family protein with ferritin-like domain